MSPTYGYSTAHPTRTAFLRNAERQDVAAGIGLAKLALWYASENVPFETSVAALEQRVGGDATEVRVAYECLAFGHLSHSTHTQVMALFLLNDLRSRVERSARGKAGWRGHAATAWRRLRRPADSRLG